MINKNTHRVRELLIATLIICFAILSTIFIYQYNQFKEVEPRLAKAYKSINIKSTTSYKLFAVFAEVEHYFRIYSINHNKDDFNNYNLKIKELKRTIDSLSTIPFLANSFSQSKDSLHLENNLSYEFANLKRQIQEIINFADSDIQDIGKNIIDQKDVQILSSDSIISSILKDTLNNTVKLDTVVKTKQGLFKRIFNNKADTIVNVEKNEILNHNQIDIVQRNIDKILYQNNVLYKNNLLNIKSKYYKLQNTERKIILFNYSLLNKLKTGIQDLNKHEIDNIRQSEKEDFALLKTNSSSFLRQVITSLIIIFFMILTIIYYQNNVISYEKKLIEEKSYASKIAEERNSILANISHEIRTPITSLKAIIDLLKNDSAQLNIDKEIIETVDYDITIINNTIDDILHLSKLESNTVNVKFDYFSPYQITEEIINLHAYHAKNQGLKLINKNKINPNLSIYSNAFRYRQVLSNLISNAIKYTEKGSVTIYASQNIKMNKDVLEVKVVDTGIGIDINKKEQIFRKYYTGENNGNKGIGLGLHISKLLSDQINGKLDFVNNLNKGTTFIFEVPFNKFKTRTTDEDLYYKIDDLPKNIKLLFIDDSRINLFFIQQLFNNKRFIKLFNTPFEAIKYMENNHIDAVITDIIMPDQDGWYVLKQLKTNEKLKHIKVIACTSETLLIETKRRQDGFAFDYILKKPIQEHQLVEAVNSLK